MRAFIVLRLIFPYHTIPRLARKTSPKLPILCRLGSKTTTQSINQSIHSPVVSSKEMLWRLAFISKIGATAYLLTYLLTYHDRE